MTNGKSKGRKRLEDYEGQFFLWSGALRFKLLPLPSTKDFTETEMFP